MSQPTILVFASGTATGGGSGFEKLVESIGLGVLDANIVGVVSNHEQGGVRSLADKFHIPFYFFLNTDSTECYQQIATDSDADFFALSGWIKYVKGLNLATRFNPRTVFNIHPGLLPGFGGKGFHGHHVHKAVMEAFGRGEVKHSAVCMHFATDGYDEGPVFFRHAVAIRDTDTPDSLGKRVNRFEHMYQPYITNLVVHEKIRWDGVDPASLVVPNGYEIDRSER